MTEESSVDSATIIGTGCQHLVETILGVDNTAVDVGNLNLHAIDVNIVGARLDFLERRSRLGIFQSTEDVEVFSLSSGKFIFQTRFVAIDRSAITEEDSEASRAGILN